MRQGRFTGDRTSSWPVRRGPLAPRVSYDIELSFLPISRARLARRLPLNFPRPAADSLLADTFMQPGDLPKRSPKHLDRQTSMSRVAALQPTKRANRTLYRPKTDNTDSS